MFAFLETFLHAPWMLAGLATLAIPLVIHLLNRRRFDVIDWGAMQFLQISEVTRRKLMLEEILLMILRMALLGFLVLAIAGPFLDLDLPRAFGSRPPRDVVFVLDGSASMSATDPSGEKPPEEKGQEWIKEFVNNLSAEDEVGLLLARDVVQPVVGSLSRDRARIREQLQSMSAPSGTANWPQAIKDAFAILEKSQKQRREIILLSDNQKHSWADPDTMFRWELLGHELGLNRRDYNPTRPRIYSVNLAGEREAAPPNYGLAPLVSNRPVVPVDREVTIRTELLIRGQTRYSPPYKIRLEVNNKPVRELSPPGGKSGSLPMPRDGCIPFSFTHRFARAGSHLVSLILEPDPPRVERPAGYEVKDYVPGDNRQHFALEVVDSIPILLVHAGGEGPTRKSRSDFLRDALSPARDRTPAVTTRVVSLDEFQPVLLETEPRPRVVILHDIPKLQQAQVDSLTAYLAAGGGLLITLGDRAESTWYNDKLFRGGEGWLPARLEGIRGEEKNPKEAVRPDPGSFQHPILELFEKITAGGLSDARFARWWSLSTPGQTSQGIPVGQLEGPGGKYPLFVERNFQAGRILLSAVPLDNTWGSNLVDLPAFVPLAHEAVYYLAGARASDYNLRAGQPIRLRVSDETLEHYRLTPPDGPELPLSNSPGDANSYPAQIIRQETGAQLVYEGVRNPGVYQLVTPAAQTIYYVVPTDPRESDLTPCSAEERAEIAKRVGIESEEQQEAILGSPGGASQRQELWSYLLLGLIALLCLEVWMTRRLVMNR